MRVEVRMAIAGGEEDGDHRRRFSRRWGCDGVGTRRARPCRASGVGSGQAVHRIELLEKMFFKIVFFLTLLVKKESVT